MRTSDGEAWVALCIIMKAWARARQLYSLVTALKERLALVLHLDRSKPHQTDQPRYLRR